MKTAREMSGSASAAEWRDSVRSLFSLGQGLPAGGIQYIYSTAKGRLWLASERSGLVRVDDPQRTRALELHDGARTFQYSTSVITEDPSGRIYVGTGRGWIASRPDTSRVKHFTTADGLAGGDILAAFCDRDGVLG